MKAPRAVLIWLRCVCLSVVVILVVGGITRLTGSGLSMVDWRPVMGVLPPLSDSDWMEVFDQYKAFPEYQKINREMNLEGFKDIFFWEYLHRVLGRFVGLLCLLPYLWFLWRKSLDKPLFFNGLGLILLVGVQGLMGWYMVKSGLVRNPEVSHFRLAAHLGLAFAVFGLAWWMILGLTDQETPGDGSLRYRPAIICLLSLFCFQVVYGAFVSGMKAGYGFNTFPKMGEDWMPRALFGLSPFWENFVSDKFSVQFVHRWLGTILAISTAVFARFALRSGTLNELQARRFFRLLLLVFAQFCLGVLTILFLVEMPILLPVIHQLVALFLFGAFLSAVHSLRRSP
ncbi:MAG: heme A synthase [Opitutae bacterium]|nr:heme A synthase [Opitutae bacterium]